MTPRHTISKVQSTVGFLVGVLLLGGLAGCAGTGFTPSGEPHAMDTAQMAEPEVADRHPAPSSGLTGEVLYLLLLAEMAGQRQQLPLAVEAYLTAARSVADPRVAERATRIALFAGNDSAAREAAELWVRLAPGNHHGRQMLAALHIRDGDVEAAAEELEALIDLIGSDSADGFMAISGLLSREQDQRTAMAVMARLVETRQDNADALFAQAHMAKRLGEHAVAAEALERTLALRPDWTQALVLRAGLQRRVDGVVAALKDLAEAVAAYPGDRTLRTTYAQYLVDADELEAARDEFRSLARERPDDSEVRFALGLLGLQMDEVDEAERHFRFLVEQDKGNNNTLFFLGRAVESQGRVEEAERWYRRVDGGEYRFNARLQVARLMAERGEIVEARHFLRSIEPETEEEAARLLLAEGRLLLRAGHERAAFEVYSEGLGPLPGHPDLLYARAIAAERLDKLDTVEADLRQILGHDPNHVHALNALGYTLVDRTERHEEGMEYIQRAYALDPHDPAIIDSMGWGYYRLGELEQAEDYLSRAYEASGDAEVGAHLGEVLWQRGRKERARAVWDEALEAEPDNQTLRETMRRLLP